MKYNIKKYNISSRSYYTDIIELPETSWVKSPNESCNVYEGDMYWTILDRCPATDKYINNIKNARSRYEWVKIYPFFDKVFVKMEYIDIEGICLCSISQMNDRFGPDNYTIIKFNRECTKVESVMKPSHILHNMWFDVWDINTMKLEIRTKYVEISEFEDGEFLPDSQDTIDTGRMIITRGNDKAWEAALGHVTSMIPHMNPSQDDIVWEINKRYWGKSSEFEDIFNNMIKGMDADNDKVVKLFLDMKEYRDLFKAQFY